MREMDNKKVKTVRKDDRKPFKENNVKKGTKPVKEKTFKSEKPLKENTPSGKPECFGTCSASKKCGGCQLLRMSYDKQLRRKQSQVSEFMSGICKVDPIIGMKNPMYYRNKVNATFGRNRKGEIISGVYQEGTHHIVPVENCLIEDQKADEIIATIKGMLRSFKIKTYDEDSDYGLLRHVLVRVGKTSGQIMVVLVLASPILPSKNNFVKALRAKHPEITTIVLNVNDKQTSMVLGPRNITLYGPGYIEDSLCGYIFRISPNSFYQVNPVQTEVLYQKAIELAKLTGKENILDAYCGIGTIGLIASSKAKSLIGVELNPDAVTDARVNAKRNNVNNVSFYCQDAGDFMLRMAQEQKKIDVVFMDPPRSGSSKTFMDAVVTLGPEKIVYISCNPETLARDLKYFKECGYKVSNCTPVDMFPVTEHVESVVLLTKVHK